MMQAAIKKITAGIARKRPTGCVSPVQTRRKAKHQKPRMIIAKGWDGFAKVGRVLCFDLFQKTRKPWATLTARVVNGLGSFLAYARAK